MPVKICRFDELGNNRVFETSIELEGVQKEIFIFQHQGNYLAYLNSCPHTGANLNWQPGQFFSYDDKFIECSLHGALFEKGSGLCVRGPCTGQKLRAIKLMEKDGCLYL